MWLRRLRQTARDAYDFAEELGATAAAEARQDLDARLQRAVIMVFAGIATVFGAALTCAALLAITWDTPYRWWIAIGLPVVCFGLAAGLGVWLRVNRLTEPFLAVSRGEAVRGLRALKHRL